GEEDKVLKIIEWAHKGPRFARVEEVKVDWEQYKGEFKDFYIRW
ncbi:MAG: acylphosphatase, partial [Infirmifilum sp.]